MKRDYGNAWVFTDDVTTSFFAIAEYVNLRLGSLNSTPVARTLPSVAVSVTIRVTWAIVPTVRLGRRRTSVVKYADSVDSRVLVGAIYVATRVDPREPKGRIDRRYELIVLLHSH